MKFVLVNHRTPLNTAPCTECERPLDTGYLREVSSQRQYCDHDCYLRYEAKSLFMPWLTATPYVTSYGLISSFAAATCWYSISLARATLHVSELMAKESFGSLPDRG